MKIKEQINNDTTSLSFKFNLFNYYELEKLIQVLKLNKCCIELYYIDEQNQECIKLLKNYKLEFSTINLNKRQKKLIINVNSENIKHLETILSTYNFEQMSLWDKCVVFDSDVDTQLKNSDLWLDFNAEEDNMVELIYNNDQYNFLNKLYLQNNLL